MIESITVLLVLAFLVIAWFSLFIKSEESVKEGVKMAVIVPMSVAVVDGTFLLLVYVIGFILA